MKTANLPSLDKSVKIVSGILIASSVNFFLYQIESEGKLLPALMFILMLKMCSNHAGQLNLNVFGLSSGN